MPANIKFVSYKLADSQQQNLIETDFQSDLSVKHDLIKRVITDMLGFTPSAANPELTSDFEIELNQSKLQFHRQGAELSVQPALSMPVGEWIPQQLGLAANAQVAMAELVSMEASKEDLLRVVPNMISAYLAGRTEAAPEESEESVRLRAKIIELGGDEAKEMLELKVKITEIEQQIAGQRQIDEVELSTAQMTEELTEIDDKLVSVNQLVDRQKQIQTILGKYGKLLQVDLEKEGERLCQEITQLRSGDLLAAVKVKDHAVVVPSDTEQKPPKFLVRELLGMAGVSALIGVAGFLLVHDLRILIIGPLFAIFELAILAGINIVPAGIARKASGPTDAVAVAAAQTDRNRVPLLEKFFVDKAWVAALRGELESLGAAMTGRLEGKDYEQLRQLRSLVQSEFDTIKTEIGDYKSREILPEDYLRKRREVDTMKIKRAKLETAMSANENYDKIKELMEELEIEVPVAADSFIKRINPEYTDISVSKGQIMVKKGAEPKAQAVDLPAEELKAIYVWLKLNAWSKSPVRPLIFIKSGFAALSERAQAAINAKISELQNLGQVISVTALN